MASVRANIIASGSSFRDVLVLNPKDIKGNHAYFVSVESIGMGNLYRVVNAPNAEVAKLEFFSDAECPEWVTDWDQIVCRPVSRMDLFYPVQYI